MLYRYYLYHPLDHSLKAKRLTNRRETYYPRSNSRKQLA